MKRSLPFAMIAVVFVGSVAAALYLRQTVERSSVSASPKSSTATTRELTPLPGAEPAHIRGPVTAPLVLEEFADFQCPACGKLYPVLKSIEKEYGDQVSVVFREFPLTMQHVHANTAARAAEAAGLQGRFWEMHDLLFENRSSWVGAKDVQPIFEEYASRLGLDIERFKADQSSVTVQKRIDLDHQRARSLRVGRTPSLYLDGIEVPYSEMKTVDDLRAILNDALTKKAKLKI